MQTHQLIKPLKEIITFKEAIIRFTTQEIGELKREVEYLENKHKTETEEANKLIADDIEKTEALIQP